MKVFLFLELDYLFVSVKTVFILLVRDEWILPSPYPSPQDVHFEGSPTAPAPAPADLTGFSLSAITCFLQNIL